MFPRLTERRILKTKSFPFLCGPEKTLIHIHEAVVAGLSDPLRVLMSGGMQESLVRQAILEEVDPQTFILFAEYAYTRLYGVPETRSDNEMLEIQKSQQMLPRHLYCRICSSQIGHPDPDHGVICTTSRCGWGGHQSKYCRGCGKLPGAAPVPDFCSTCMGDTNSTGDQSGTFGKREYTVDGVSHTEVKEHLAKLRPADHPTSEVCRHAELFIFANMYLVEGLKQLCLHKLHRDLMVLELKEDNVSGVIELLEYTYDNTAKEEDNAGGVGVELRDLVMAYAASKANELIKFEKFREMLTKGTDLVADFTVQALGVSK